PKLLSQLIKTYIPYLKDGAIIADVTGVKSSIIDEIEPMLPDNVEFVFGHPMAGRENRVMEFSRREVFIGANYLITPNPRIKDDNMNFVKDFVKQLGFRSISVITPDLHDEVIGFTSQLAHVIAISLLN